MKNNDIEKRLSSAFTHAAPQADCKALSPRSEKGTVIDMPSAQTDQAKKKSWPYKLAAAAAAFFILFGGAFGYMQYDAYHTVDSVVDLDVNPSIELKLNKNEKVLSATALNADAEAILDGMDLSKTDLDVALNAIIGSMVKQGYISELANSILISVDNADAQRSAALQNRLAAEIEKLLRANSIDPAVISQTLENNSAQALAEEHGISLGKASLIENIVSTNSLLNSAELAKLSVNELLLIANSKAQGAVTDVSGSASDKAYIGEDAAKAAALTHAGVNESELFNLKIEMDVENGIMVYEVDFHVGNREYDYEINAVTGAVVKYENETDDDFHAPSSSGTNPGTGGGTNSGANGGNGDTQNGTGSSGTENVPSPAPGSYISKETAKNTALAHAGVSAANAKHMEIELDEEDGIMVYDIEFVAGGIEYSYEIDAATGAVREYESEADE